MLSTLGMRGQKIGQWEGFQTNILGEVPFYKRAETLAIITREKSLISLWMIIAWRGYKPVLENAALTPSNQ